MKPILQLLLTKPPSSVDKSGEVAYIEPCEGNNNRIMFSHLCKDHIRMPKKKWDSEVRILCEAHGWGYSIHDTEGNLIEGLI